jgi:hypothetical protein
MRDDDHEMSYEEFEEMRIRLRRECAQLVSNGWGLDSIRRMNPKDPAFNRKVSRRENQYLAWVERLSTPLDGLFS